MGVGLGDGLGVALGVASDLRPQDAPLAARRYVLLQHEVEVHLVTRSLPRVLQRVVPPRQPRLVGLFLRVSVRVYVCVCVCVLLCACAPAPSSARDPRGTASTPRCACARHTTQYARHSLSHASGQARWRRPDPSSPRLPWRGERRAGRRAGSARRTRKRGYVSTQRPRNNLEPKRLWNGRPGRGSGGRGALRPHWPRGPLAEGPLNERGEGEGGAGEASSDVVVVLVASSLFLQPWRARSATF